VRASKEKQLEFHKSRIVKGRALPLPERLRAARGVPQAVVKLASYGQGRSEAMGQVDYISRKGKLELETESGEKLITREEQKVLIEEWARDFDGWRKSRDTVHLVFSMPHGSPPKALQNAVRKVLRREFADHEAVFAIHLDKKHPHAHVVMKMRSRDHGKKLDLRVNDLLHLREVFAHAAREEGVEMAASSRAARGVGRKGMKRPIFYMRRNKLVPRSEKETAQEALFDLQQGRVQEKPWEKAMRERNRQERDAYQAEADKLRVAAQGSQDRELLLRAAADLERFSKTMPTPRTLRQTILAKLGHEVPSSSQDRKQPSQADLDR